MEAYRNSREIILFLVLIPIINGINYFITYSDIQFDSYFILTITIDTLQGYMTWLLVRWVIFFMERKEPLIPFRLKRLLNQLGLTSLVSLTAIALTTEMINHFVKDTPVPIHFYTHDMVIYLIWILVINGIYIGIYFYWHFNRSKEALERETELDSKYVLVPAGTSQKKIPIPEVAAVYVSDGYYFLIDKNDTSYLINTTLDQMEEELPKGLFFRVNRKYLLHRDAIRSFSKASNKKLHLQTVLDKDLENPLLVSRLKAKSFKEWFARDSAS